MRGLLPSSAKFMVASGWTLGMACHGFDQRIDINMSQDQLVAGGSSLASVALMH